jgi:hypothetical protein
MAPDSYHRISGGRQGFEVSRGIVIAELVARLNRVWFALPEDVK